MKNKTKRAPAAPASRTPSFSLRRLAAPAALLLLALAAYSNSFSTGLPLDNQTLLLNDSRIQSATAQNLSLIFEHSYWWPNGESGLYRPLTTLSYLLNYAILGNRDHPEAYHALNFLLHAANVLLFYLLLRRLLSPRPHAGRIAFFAAALWAVHPVLTESVTNIVGRADLLAGFSVLSGLLFYLKFAETRRVVWLAGLTVTTAIGVFSKESAVVLPGIVVLYEFLSERRWKPMIEGCAATLIPIALMLWQRWTVLSAALPAEYPFLDNPITAAGFWNGRLTALAVLGRYLWLAIWPAKLSADYSYPQIRLASGSLYDWLAWLTLAAVLAACAILWKRSRLALFFAVFGFLNLLPASNLLFPIGTIMAERLLYLSLAGWIAAAVIAIADLLGQGIAAPAFAIAVAAICCTYIARTYLRNADWSSDLTMATAGVKSAPLSFKFHRLLAAELLADSAHRDVDRAAAEADRAVAILAPVPDDRNNAGPWNVAAISHRMKGDALSGDSARAQYEEAARLALRSIAIDQATRAAYDRVHGLTTAVPASAAEAYRTLASAYLHLNRATDALGVAGRAQSIDPSNTTVYEQIADAQLRLNRGEESAIALAWGMFAANSQSLRTELLRLYQSGIDSQGCAVVAGPRGPALNPNCPIVVRDLCEATRRANRPDLRSHLACPAN